MSIPPAASMAPTWFVEAAPVTCAGPEVVGPTGVAVAEPAVLALATTVPLPLGEGPPLGPGPPVTIEVKVVPVPEAITVVGTVVAVLVVTVVDGVQSGRVKVPL